MYRCNFETAASCGIDCSYQGSCQHQATGAWLPSCNRQAHEEPPVPQWHECRYCSGTVEGTTCLQCGESG